MARIEVKIDETDRECTGEVTESIDALVAGLCKAASLGDPADWVATIQLHRVGENLPGVTAVFGPTSREQRIGITLSAVGSDIYDQISDPKMNYLVVAKRALQLAYGDMGAQFIVVQVRSDGSGRAEVIPMDGIPPLAEGGLRPIGVRLLDAGKSVHEYEQKIANLVQRSGAPS